MIHRTDDLRITRLRPLLPPAILMEELPVTERCSRVVEDGRNAASAILRGEDDRALVVVGPCSIHDTEAALDYAARLVEVADEVSEDLCVMMRVYFEKPRTTVGWKGLINDPKLDGSFAINEGLRRARRLLIDLGELGLPVGTEFLDPISPQFIADLVSWGAIGARTSESQVHRELASGLSMPVGFKNGTDGTTQIAIDAIRSSAHPHQFLSVSKQGVSAIVETAGNTDCHVILRGGSRGPNFSSEDIHAVTEKLEAVQLNPRVMVDCSHANSGKDPSRQPAVLEEVASQIAGGSDAVFGVMIESFIEEGNQSHTEGQALRYGQSITDACLGWEDTRPLFLELAEAVRKRRAD